MTHGKNGVFSCLGIQLCVDFFLKRGHEQITAMVPQWRTRKADKITDQYLLKELNEKGYLEFTPSRRAGGQFIVPYDDRLIVQTADMTDGVIISNDNYRDLYDEKPQWQHIIKERLIQYMFVGDHFIIAEVDPVGRHGPTLEQLLTIPDPSARPRVPPLMGNNPPLMGNNPTPQGRRIRGRYTQAPASHLPNQGVAQHSTGTAWPRQQHGPGKAWGSLVPAAVESQPQYRQHRAANQFRTQEKTEELVQKLLVVFPENEEEIRRVISNHPKETDPNKLTGCVLHVLP